MFSNSKVVATKKLDKIENGMETDQAAPLVKWCSLIWVCSSFRRRCPKMKYRMEDKHLKHKKWPPVAIDHHITSVPYIISLIFSLSFFSIYIGFDTNSACASIQSNWIGTNTFYIDTSALHKVIFTKL